LPSQRLIPLQWEFQPLKTPLHIAVRTLAAFSHRSGDLDRSFQHPASALEGIRAHQKIQNARPDGYIPEHSLVGQMETERFIIDIRGRVDGVWQRNGRTVVEEIKTTSRDLAGLTPHGHDSHWAQLTVYAWMVARERNLPVVDGQLTYCRQGTGEILELHRELTIEAASAFVNGLIDRYLSWAELLLEWRNKRDASIRKLSFPHRDFRAGQRAMAVAVYRSIREKDRLMVEAPTGIGKTMAALFPAVKAVAEGLSEGVFYLTARTTGRQAAEAALERMRKKGLHFRALSLTAKDKLCVHPESACTPEECPCARGHYDRLTEAMEAAMATQALTRQVVADLADRHRVCPFAFSLELVQWVDAVICDYNYAFDPRVHLRGFFQENPASHTFLVDEAHNLVDRARDMFSAELAKQPILALRRSVHKRLPGLYRSLGRINRWMAAARKTADTAGGQRSDPQPPDGLAPLLRDAVYQADRWLIQNEKADWRDGVLDFYFTVTNYLRILDAYDHTYSTCYESDGRQFRIKLFCIDPSGQLGQAIGRARSVVFFSATLSPPAYFLTLFGCDPKTPFLALSSPYPMANLKLLVDGTTSTYFNERQSTSASVVEAIRAATSGKPGNYLCFFPSYVYMAMVHEAFSRRYPRTATLVQTPAMSESERDDYLNRFGNRHPETLIGFAVMGGIFGEGIDLAGDRLSGAVIIGVGLPAPSPERELIRSYFADSHGAGFEYAYQYPGMNRVLQAAGRVIRSEEDRGVVLLLDRRYRTRPYRTLFPEDWRPVMAAAPKDIARIVAHFWSARGPSPRKQGHPQPNKEHHP
jgi:DNA excision repair protein ERCC-2